MLGVGSVALFQKFVQLLIGDGYWFSCFLSRDCLTSHWCYVLIQLLSFKVLFDEAFVLCIGSIDFIQEIV